MLHKFKTIEIFRDECLDAYFHCNKHDIYRYIKLNDDHYRDNLIETVLNEWLFCREIKVLIGPHLILERVVNYLGINRIRYQNAINEIDDFVESYRQSSPHIFIQTDFDIQKFNGILYTLKLLAPYRFIPLEIDCFTTDYETQLSFVKWVINMHKNTITDTLPCWGKVTGYEYNFSKDQCLCFDKNGEIIL